MAAYPTSATEFTPRTEAIYELDESQNRMFQMLYSLASRVSAIEEYLETIGHVRDTTDSEGDNATAVVHSESSDASISSSTTGSDGEQSPSDDLSGSAIQLESHYDNIETTLPSLSVLPTLPVPRIAIPTTPATSSTVSFRKLPVSRLEEANKIVEAINNALTVSELKTMVMGQFLRNQEIERSLEHVMLEIDIVWNYVNTHLNTQTLPTTLPTARNGGSTPVFIPRRTGSPVPIDRFKGGTDYTAEHRADMEAYLNATLSPKERTGGNGSGNTADIGFRCNSPLRHSITGSSLSPIEIQQTRVVRSANSSPRFSARNLGRRGSVTDRHVDSKGSAHPV